MAAGVVAVIATLGLVFALIRRGPYIPNYPVTSPSTRGFGAPCRPSTFVKAPFFDLGAYPWNPDAVLPLRAAERLVAATTTFRPTTFSGSYNCRPVRGGKTLSHHAWAVAVDFDAAVNCLGCAAGTSEIGRQPAFVQAFRRFGFSWGGEFSRSDPMHFEYDGPRVPNRPVLHLGDHGTNVRALEALMARLGLPCKADGFYSAAEQTEITAFQKSWSLFYVDKPGNVGAATWTYLVQRAAAQR